MSSQARSATGIQTRTAPWRSIGVWMAVVLVLYILYNSVRATLTPTEFAASYGAPLTDPSNNGFVYVYAIRSLFLGLFGLALILTRNLKTLAIYALVAVVMPIGDAVLVANKGAEVGRVIQHLLTGVFLLLTSFFLWRGTRSVADSSQPVQ